MQLEPPFGDLMHRPVETHSGGLLAVDSRVQVRYPDAHGSGAVSGDVVAVDSSPAPHIVLNRETGGRFVVFLGPGVTVEPLSSNPGLA